MIDTHAHLDFKDFNKDREEVISRAFNNGVKKIINVGVDLERSRKSIEIAEKHKDVFAAVGFHPEYFSKATLKLSFRVDEFRKLAKHEKVVAIGETGLDYFHIARNTQHITQKELEKIKENQKKGFVAQIDIARELGLPVIVHCRNSADSADKADVSGKKKMTSAWEDVFEIISGFSKSSTLSSPDYSSGDSPELSFPKFVLHCYSGEKKDTEKFLKLPNVHFSFSGNITYPKPAERAEKLAEAVLMVPLDKIMLDSDAPFLAPQETRGKRNEPIFVKYIAKKIAEIKGISEEEVEKKTDENAVIFFGVSL